MSSIMKPYSLSTPKIYILTALACEAKPLIAALKLQKTELPCGGHVYINRDNSVELMITGVGPVKAAVATARLLRDKLKFRHAYLLNVGIAGGEKPIGACYCIHKITDADLQKSWYPPFLKKATEGLTTFNAPQTNYSEGLIDMEASGIIQAALSFITRDQIYFLKIVSDNPSQTTHTINASYVSELINDNLATIVEAIDALIQKSTQLIEYSVTIDVSPITDKWHFSHYQQHQLRDLLTRLAIRIDDFEPLELLDDAKTSRDVLTTLSAELDNTIEID